MDFDRCPGDVVEADEDPGLSGRTIETAPDLVTLRAVTQIAPGGLWVTATVQWIRPNFPDMRRAAPWTVVGQLRRSVAHHPPEDTQVRC
jgi:hypothetical protein